MDVEERERREEEEEEEKDEKARPKREKRRGGDDVSAGTSSHGELIAAMNSYEGSRRISTGMRETERMNAGGC